MLRVTQRGILAICITLLSGQAFAGWTEVKNPSAVWNLFKNSVETAYDQNYQTYYFVVDNVDARNNHTVFVDAIRSATITIMRGMSQPLRQIFRENGVRRDFVQRIQCENAYYDDVKSWELNCWIWQ